MHPSAFPRRSFLKSLSLGASAPFFSPLLSRLEAETRGVKPLRFVFFHETAFLEMLENETPPESKVFYVMPVTREQKREISDRSGTWGIKDIAADTAQATGLENILDW